MIKKQYGINAVEALRQMIVKDLLKDIEKGKFGTKNRVELILRMNKIIKMLKPKRIEI